MPLQGKEQNKIRIFAVFGVLGAVAGVVMQFLAIFDFMNDSEILTILTFFFGICLMLAGTNVALVCKGKLNAAHKARKKGKPVHKIAKLALCTLCESVVVSFFGFMFLGRLIEFHPEFLDDSYVFESFTEVWQVSMMVSVVIIFSALIALIISLIAAVVSWIVIIAGRKKDKKIC